MIITKTKIFSINLLSCIAFFFLAFYIAFQKGFQMYFWIPILIYFLTQCCLFYFSAKTKIKKIRLAGLINLFIALVLSVCFAFIVLTFIKICAGLGAMKG